MPENDDGVDCPTCGKTCKNEHGMHIHHTTAHGESLTQETSTCDYCGEKYVVQPGATGVYCSNECNHLALRDRVELECYFCGDMFEAEVKEAADGRKFCSHDCYAASLEVRKEFECASCGRDFSVYPSAGIKYCSRACMFEDRTSKPRPVDLDGLLWVLYVYEGHNARETWLRANAHTDEWLTQETVRDRLRNNGWMAPGARPKYSDLTWEDLNLNDPPDTRDDLWRKYYYNRDGQSRAEAVSDG